MSDLNNYFSAQKDTALARQQYETAQVRIELCEIRERAARMKSQHDPLAHYADRPLTRAELLEVINLVVTGRKED